MTQSADDTPIVVWGLGTGRRLLPLLRSGREVIVMAVDISPQGPEKARLVVQQSEELCDCVEQGKLRVLVGSAGELSRAFALIGEKYAPLVPDVDFDPTALQEAPGSLQDLAHTIERVYAERRRPKRAELQMRTNLGENIPALASAWGVDKLAGLAKGRAAFVLAAGPSLNVSLSALGSRAPGPVIAVDTALPPCSAAGVQADIVCSVDAHPDSAMHVRTVNDEEPQPMLAFQPYAYPEVVSKFSKRVAAMVTGDRLSDEARELGLPVLEPGGSVLIYAFQIAQIMGANPIVLVGADLAFVGGQTHAQGSARVRQAEVTELSSPTWSGQTIATSSELIRFRRELEVHIAKSDTEVLTVDGGGASIAGCRRIEPEELAALVREHSHRAGFELPVYTDRCDDLSMQRRRQCLEDAKLRLESKTTVASSLQDVG